MNRLLLCSTIAILCCAGAAFGQAPPNDTCAGAIVFVCGQTINLQTNTTAANNNYDQASVCTGFNSLGPDIVYRIDIPNGGTVTFQLDTEPPAGSGYDGSLYLITDCANPSGSCLVGDDGDPVGGDFVENISYTNNTGLTQTTFLIVDGFMGISAPDRGTGTLTGTVTCPTPTGACCATDGTCSITTQAACNGTWQGAGTGCTPNPCTPPPTGACCATDGTCSITTQAACTGTWQGPGSDCDPNPCIGPPTGACCRPGQACAITTRTDCEANGGQYFGDGSTCGPPDPCQIVPVEPSTWGRIKNIYGK